MRSHTHTKLKITILSMLEESSPLLNLIIFLFVTFTYNGNKTNSKQKHK